MSSFVFEKLRNFVFISSSKIFGSIALLVVSRGFIRSFINIIPDRNEASIFCVYMDSKTDNSSRKVQDRQPHLLLDQLFHRS